MQYVDAIFEFGSGKKVGYDSSLDETSLRVRITVGVDALSFMW